jgi:hypothetical protein
MKIGTFVAFTLFALAVFASAFTAELTAEDVELGHFMGLTLDEYATAIQNLSPDHRAHLYSYFRQNRGAARWRSLSRLDSTRLLFALGEPETRRELIERFRKDPYDTGAGLSWVGDPAIIEALATDLTRGERKLPETGGELIPLAVAVRALIVMRETIKHSHAFNPEVVEWAKRNSFPNAPGDDGLAAFRRWWDENARFFRTKDYASVKPGIDFAFASAPGEPAPAETLSPAQLSPTMAAPVESRSISRQAVAAPQSLDTQPLRVLLAGATLAVAALVTVLYCWKRRI